MAPRLYAFIGGDSGLWRVVETSAIVGEALPAVRRLTIQADATPPTDPRATWVLRGITSHERYAVDAQERSQLLALQPPLGQPEASRAALIPIRKNPAWWALSQTERQAIFGEQSRHAQIGLHRFPALARRLHHCRDLSEHEPFDFLTWFEYAPTDEAVFNRLLEQLRATPEWSYVEREVDIRLIREAT